MKVKLARMVYVYTKLKIGRGGLIAGDEFVQVISSTILGDLTISTYEILDVECNNNNMKVKIMGTVIIRNSRRTATIRNVVPPNNDFNILRSGEHLYVERSKIGSLKITSTNFPANIQQQI